MHKHFIRVSSKDFFPELEAGWMICTLCEKRLAGHSNVLNHFATWPHQRNVMYTHGQLHSYVYHFKYSGRPLPPAIFNYLTFSSAPQAGAPPPPPGDPPPLPPPPPPPPDTGELILWSSQERKKTHELVLRAGIASGRTPPPSTVEGLNPWSSSGSVEQPRVPAPQYGQLSIAYGNYVAPNAASVPPPPQDKTRSPAPSGNGKLAKIMQGSCVPPPPPPQDALRPFPSSPFQQPPPPPPQMQGASTGSWKLPPPPNAPPPEKDGMPPPPGSPPKRRPRSGGASTQLLSQETFAVIPSVTVDRAAAATAAVTATVATESSRARPVDTSEQSDGAAAGATAAASGAPKLSDGSSSSWQRYLTEDGIDYWWHCYDTGDWFLEKSSGTWTKYSDPNSGKCYWWQSNERWFWESAVDLATEQREDFWV